VTPAQGCSKVEELEVATVAPSISGKESRLNPSRCQPKVPGNEKVRCLHEVSLEESGQLPLGRRVREVSDVESATLSSAGQNGVILVSGGRVGSLVGNGSVAKSGSNVVDGVRNFLHDGRHGDLRWWLFTENLSVDGRLSTFAECVDS
jgi:hypothetical protein